MKEAKLYYTAPDEKYFDEVKKKALDIWKRYEFADDKIKQIGEMTNIRDNFMYMVAMFDDSNQRKLSTMLSDEVRREVSDRIISVNGNDSNYNYFK